MYARAAAAEFRVQSFDRVGMQLVFRAAFDLPYLKRINRTVDHLVALTEDEAARQSVGRRGSGNATLVGTDVGCSGSGESGPGKPCRGRRRLCHDRCPERCEDERLRSWQSRRNSGPLSSDASGLPNQHWWLPQTGAEGHQYVTSTRLSWSVRTTDLALPQSLFCEQALSLSGVPVVRSYSVEMVTYPGASLSPARAGPRVSVNSTPGPWTQRSPHRTPDPQPSRSTAVRWAAPVGRCPTRFCPPRRRAGNRACPSMTAPTSPTTPILSSTWDGRSGQSTK